jgi:hypothetical protein
VVRSLLASGENAAATDSLTLEEPANSRSRPTNVSSFRSRSVAQHRAHSREMVLDFESFVQSQFAEAKGNESIFFRMGKPRLKPLRGLERYHTAERILKDILPPNPGPAQRAYAIFRAILSHKYLVPLLEHFFGGICRRASDQARR